jgi:hypothetical protein
MPSNNVTAPLASTLNLVVSWWLPTWQQSAEFPDLYGLCLQRTIMKHFRRVPTGLTHCYHAQQQRHCPLGFFITCGSLMVAAYISAECGICRLVRRVPPAHHHEHFCRVPTGLTHCYHAQRQRHCPLGFYSTCGGLMVAACMAAICGISRVVWLVPPAHHHETLSPSSNRPNTLLPCPATTSLPPWLLH